MSPLDEIAPLSCQLCPRLVSYLANQKVVHPEWHNAPVPSFGPASARLLIFGLAPGLRGANSTGRPFTGDHAGETLYKTLLSHGLAAGDYAPDGHDNLVLPDIRISNAVRCVPPQNKPTPDEVRNCRPYLEVELAKMSNLQVILCLGKISHDSILRHFQQKLSAYPFAHGAEHHLSNGLLIIDSYHCSRYNTQTRRLTQDMFDAVFNQIKARLA